MTSRIPRIVHFVFGLRPQDEPFHLVHYLAVASCRAVVQPDEIVVHHHELPYGLYWDLARPLVTLRRVDRVREVTEFAYDDPIVARYSYAHEADFVRLDVLAEFGGMYADIDTAFVAPVRDHLWDAPAVIGREPDAFDVRIGRSRPSLSNALVMAEPGSTYVRRWRDQIAAALDGSWAAHSCFLADDLARAHPDEVRVEPQRRFHRFGPTPDGMRRLLVDPPRGSFTGVASVHLAAHLWWEEERRDFSDVHARMITEQWVRSNGSTYAALVRPYLPVHARLPIRTGTVKPLPVARRRVPGRAAAFRYVAEDAPTGYADAADRLVRAVRDDGVDLEYRGWSNTHGGEDPAFVVYSRDERPNDRVVEDAGAPTVAHLVPEYYPLVRDVLDARHDRGPLIAHTVWETDRVPAHWPALLNDVDRVIVPSAWNRDVFASGGVRTPIEIVSHVACDPVPGSDAAVAALGVPDDVVAFYTIGRWDERKAMFHTVRAFLEAFTADDPVELVVKTGMRIEMRPAEGWGATNPLAWTTGWQVAQIVRHYPRPAHVRVEVATWSDDEVAALHTRGDCFVGLARGEGWGIGAFDACAYGNPVIATGWGGYLEYLTPEHAFLVDHEIAHVEHHAYASYSPDQRWAEPSIGHAVEALRTVARDLDGARRRAAPLRERVLTEFAPNQVARRFLDALQ
jgi:hypothetical protein